MTSRGRITDGSCWACRKRRIKCDLARPSCTPCQTKSQSCSYSSTAPVKWVGGMALRGRLASKDTSCSENVVFAPLAPPSTPTPDQNHLIIYFMNAVLPRFYIPEHTPFGHDLNTITQDKSLSEAILALSQAHYAWHGRVLSDEKAVIRKSARASAICQFRKRLELGIDSDSTAQALFVNTILLCVLDGMIEPSNETNASMYHLKGGFAILDRRSRVWSNMLVQNGFQAHLLSLFATIDLVHALLSGEKPFFDSIIWIMFAEAQAWWGCLPRGDRFLEILKTYSDMAVLGQLVHLCSPSSARFNLIDKYIPTIESMLQPRIDLSSDEGNFDTPNHWFTFCSMFEIAGTLYMLRALQQRSIDDEKVQSITKKAIEKLLHQSLPGMLQHCLIFPILVIGVHCIEVHDRQVILAALASSATYLSFGNLQLMKNFLGVTWDQTNLAETWWSVVAPISKNVFLF